MYDFLNTFTQLISVAIALAAMMITAILNWKALKRAWDSRDVQKARNKVDSHRRKLIKAFPILAVGIGGWGIIRFTPIYESLKKGLYHFLPSSNELVVNDKNGVIHHKVLCSEHLPKKTSKSTPYKLAAKTRFHGSQKVGILSELTKDVSAEDAIEILLLAADDNPTSVHIYDRIVRLLGKIKRYESIHILLENAEANLLEKIKDLRTGSKKHKKYSKAISHIQLQRHKARERARYSALRI
ncbi:hypothetical protein M3I01_007170 [Marinomonas sp. RSW2]|uniref:Uncharacterized protein n=1 Tax=Marinomonas maritima TaxID=2940935 RepID=A0ABT5WD13_9GAMM|nr:hypothetical protein [Marinomonas maritima]MDE8602704.1 hypothetical protein [Marinomonas maritima]